MQYDMEMIIYELYNDIMQKDMHWEFTEVKVTKNVNMIFGKHFLNMDISAPIAHNSTLSGTYIYKIQMEGRGGKREDT